MEDTESSRTFRFQHLQRDQVQSQSTDISMSFHTIDIYKKQFIEISVKGVSGGVANLPPNPNYLYP